MSLIIVRNSRSRPFGSLNRNPLLFGDNNETSIERRKTVIPTVCLHSEFEKVFPMFRPFAPCLAGCNRVFSTTSSANNDRVDTPPISSSSISSEMFKDLSSAISSYISPSSSSSTRQPRNVQARIAKSLFQHVWPAAIARSNTDSNVDDSHAQKEDEASVKLRKQRVIGSIGLMVAGKAVTIQVPYIFKHLVDSLPNMDAVVTSNAASALGEEVAVAAAAVPAEAAAAFPIFLLLGYGTSRIASIGFQEYRNAVFVHVAQDAIRKVGRQVFDHVHSLDMQFHLSRNTGQLSRILDRGNRSIQFVLNSMVFHITPTIVEVALVTGLLSYQFGLTHGVVVMSTVGCYIIFTVGISTWRTKFRRDMNKLENQASGYFVDSLINYETVQYFNNTKHEGDRYETSLRGYQNEALSAQYSLSLLNVGQAAIFSVGLTSIMGLTTLQILNGTASVGDLVLANGLLFQLSVPLFFIGSVYREVKQGLIDLEYMFKLLDTKPSIVDKSNAIFYDSEAMGSSIRFNDIHFTYPTSTGDDTEKEDFQANERKILHGATFEVPQGKTVALVGSSGCGKSTLLRLLYRFYEPNQGTISIGGVHSSTASADTSKGPKYHNIQDLSQDSLRRAIAVVPQDTVLFHESIFYNIQYGNLNSSYDEVIEAAKKANIHDTILSFPNGYDTVVGERGLKLSGGEKQRVAIARAILKNAKILLCDEPTSSLDTSTEFNIMNHLVHNIAKGGGCESEGDKGSGCSDTSQGNAMNNGGITTIIIAHRLSTIQDCDEIIVLDKGQVIERGTHTDLLAIPGGKYSELLKMQSQQY